MKVVFLSRAIILTRCLRRAPCNDIPNLGAVGVLEFAPFPTLPSLAVAEAALAFSVLTTHPFPTLPSLAVVEAALAFSVLTKWGRAPVSGGLWMIGQQALLYLFLLGMKHLIIVL